MEGPAYYDTITPYGFSGPIILSGEPENKQQLAELFNEEFQEYCDEHRIVTEYIRFNPWMKNRQDFEQFYEFRDNGHMLYIEIDYTGESVGEFHRMYMLTAEKNQIAPYYMFSEESLRRSFETFQGKQFLISAKHEGRYISSSLMLHHGDYLHYHLAANEPEFYSLAGNSLVIYEACRWGVEHGKKELHLGGAGNDENLYRFKRNFTKTEPLELLMGKKIRNQQAYDQLVEAKRQNGGIQIPGFFPLYRG